MKIVDDTVFVGVYGAMQLHPWLESGALTEDAYSLFVSRAASMGWASTSAEGFATAVWGMNDAGQDWSSPRIAWYQVALPRSSSGGQPLPLQPLLACVEDSLSRIGELTLTGLQLLLPLQRSGGAWSQLASGLNWFGLCNPGARTPIRVVLDTGESDEIRPHASGVLARLRECHTGAFSFDSLSLGGSPPAQLVPPVVDDLWMGEGHHCVTLEATVPEWSFGALGWVFSLIAEACRDNGLRTTVLASMSRSSPATV
jgi:hypothetical protein